MSGKVWKLSGVLNVLEILSGKCLGISFSLLLKKKSHYFWIPTSPGKFVLMKILYNPVFY